jgi:hypothetical protein
MGLMFENLDTVFHISDFIGKDVSSELSSPAKISTKKYNAKTNTHSTAAEPIVKFDKR